VKERDQNPVCGEEIVLRHLQFNENSPTDVELIEMVEIYFLDPFNRSAENPDGRRLVQTITDITREDVGSYSVTFELTKPLFTIGRYVDVWYITFQTGDCTANPEHTFEVLPDKWYSATEPFLWSFDFVFRPNKFRKNEKKYIVVEVTPNVPHATDLERYYADINTFPSLYVTAAMRCGDCVPAEVDLRTVIDRSPVEVRNRRYGYYFLDTTELDCGIYDIWFELELGGNTYISPRNQFQIYD